MITIKKPKRFPQNQVDFAYSLFLDLFSATNYEDI